MSTVSIIGLGKIGAGVARCLAKAGFDVTGYDVRAEAFLELGEQVRAFDSPAVASDRADVALIAVMDDAQTREALDGEYGILRASTPPRVVVILATVTMPTIFWAAETAAAHGVAVLDCGVSGGTQGLQHAAITAMVGGEGEAFAIAEPVIAGFSDPVIHCGELGNGMRAKLARNLIIYTDWATAWEGARLALAAGVPLEKFVECVTASDRWVKPHMEMVERGVGLPGADGAPIATAADTAVYADKDLRAALALGADLGVELPAAELALTRFRAAAGLE